MPKAKNPNYLKFILIVFVIIFIVLTILAMTSKTPETASDPLADILNEFRAQPQIETSNLMSFVKKNIITEPTTFKTSPILGPVDAPVTIFEFSCFGCPASRDIQPILKEVLNKYPQDVKLVWKDLPIPDLYPEADLAHLAARCAQTQGKFWEYQEKLWQNQADFSLKNLKTLGQDIKLNIPQLTECINNKTFQNLIDADIGEAAQLSISGTPHFYVNNQEIFGVATLEDFEIVINAELSR